MTKKLEGNGRWESSRFMLPQHIEALNKHSRNSAKRLRPDLTEEENQELYGRITASYKNYVSATITLFGEFEDRQITGIVTGLDPRQHLLKVQTRGDWHLIKFIDVIGVELDAPGH